MFLEEAVKQLNKLLKTNLLNVLNATDEKVSLLMKKQSSNSELSLRKRNVKINVHGNENSTILSSRRLKSFSYVIKTCLNQSHIKI